MINIILLSLMLFITGCGKTYYVNHSHPERNFSNDSAICSDFAHSNTPRNTYNYYSSLQPSYHVGNFSGFNSRGDTYFGSYNSYGMIYNPNADQYNWHQIRQNAANNSMRESLYNNCLRNLGWIAYTEEQYKKLYQQAIQKNHQYINRLENQKPTRIINTTTWEEYNRLKRDLHVKPGEASISIRPPS